MTVVCADVVAPEGAAQSSTNLVVVASASVEVEPVVPVAIKNLLGAKSSQLDVLMLDQMRRDFPPCGTVVGFAISVAIGFGGVVVALGGVIGGITGGIVGLVCCDCDMPKNLPSAPMSPPRVFPNPPP